MSLTHAVLVVVGLAYAAAGAAADAGAPADRTASKDERVVCFAEKTTGSHLRKRICMTEAEREARRQADQRAMGETRRSTAAAGASRGRD